MSTQQRFNIGVKGLVVRDGRVLILRVRGEDFWELPGGRIDEGEQIEDTLRREIAEELGKNDVQIKEIVHAQIGQRPYPAPFRLMLIMFRVHIKAGPFMLSDEHTDVRWATAQDLDSLPMPQPDLSAIRKLLK
ncbi:MAG TPA: NUDIX domain-containing protein [Bacillota bacterium]|nr:NUDIX domain-containing protein [Bacillota bacterium]